MSRHWITPKRWQPPPPPPKMQHIHHFRNIHINKQKRIRILTVQSSFKSKNIQRSEISAVMRINKIHRVRCQRTVAHKYNNPLIWTLLLCRAFFFFSLCSPLFGSSRCLSAVSSFLSVLPSVFRLCWALFGSAKHFPSVPCIFLQKKRIPLVRQ